MTNTDTTTNVETIKYNDLKKLAKKAGITVHNPKKATLVSLITEGCEAAAALATAFTALATEKAAPQLRDYTEFTVAERVRNRGFEAKVALRFARMHPEALDEATLRKNVELRFQLFFSLREHMTVLGLAEPDQPCDACGQVHVGTCYYIDVAGLGTVVVGSRCAENLAYINGSGLFKEYKELCEWDATEAAIADGTIDKNTHRIHKMRVTKGVTRPELPEDAPECTPCPIG